MTIQKINLDTDNRMLRIGFGKHEAKYFLELIYGFWHTPKEIT